jgi:hypothetical protein
MCKTIKHKVRFKASPGTIYELLADSRKRTQVTGRKAVMSDKVGGNFSTDAGQVTGVNVDLVPGRRGGTELVLTHRGVPKHLLDDTEEYWRRLWAPMRAAVTTSAPLPAN